MKILIDARLYGLEHAGLGRYVINLIKELATLNSNEEFTILLRDKYFNKIKLPKKWKRVKADFRHYSLLEQIKIPQIIKKENPDIVHFPHFNVPIFYNGKFVVTIHDLLMHRSKGKDATTLPQYKYLIKRFGYHYVFNKAVNNSVKIIVPSKHVKKDLVDYYQINEDKVVVTYEGFSNHKYNDSLLKLSDSKILGKYGIQKPYFIYVGNSYPHKNLERAIEACVFLNKKSKDKVRLAIVSSRDVFTKKLEKVMDRQGAKDYVRLLGFVPDQHLGVLLGNSVAFVYPSLSEGFGLQGLESIAAGALVIASDIPVFKEIYKDHVIYFNPFDFSSIAQAMEDVLNMNTRKKQRVIKKGQKFIQHYSWTKMAKQTLDVYNSILNESSVGL